MAKPLYKTNRITIRFADEQSRKLVRAAQLESQRRGEDVPESALARELIMAGVEPILASAQQPELATA